jgi:diacylglycerol kinase (ATP)
MVLRAATVGLGKQPRVSHFDFATTKVTPIQIDGEVMHADASSQVVIACVSHALTTVG